MQLPRGVPSAGSVLGDCPAFFSAVSAGALCGIAPIIIMSLAGLPLELKIVSNWSGLTMMGQLVGKEKPLSPPTGYFGDLVRANSQGV